MELYHMDEH
jgi:hypothetical protein